MPYLIALGPEPLQKWQYPLSSEGKLRIGRFSESESGLNWDREISRDHADVFWQDGKFHISCLESARNPIIRHGRQYKQIQIEIGDEFQIGKTHFRIADDGQDTGLSSLLEKTQDPPGEQTQYALRLADLRAELVSGYTATMWMSNSEKELAQHVVDILGKVILHAESIVLLECNMPQLLEGKYPKVISKRPKGKKSGTVINLPMVTAAFTRSKSIMNICNELDESGNLEKTGNGRWSFCTPIQSDTQNDWCVYVTGKFGNRASLPAFLTTEDLNGDVSFTELVVQMIRAIRKVLMLEDRFSGIRQFFSPAVMKSVEKANQDMSLDPTEGETAVLYCDLRGYSKMIESGRDNLKELLTTVSKSLGIMTENIISHDGVIADFQGDSALGFWGWPVPLSEGPLPACRAALKILSLFLQNSSSQTNGILQGFKIGLGISCGTAIAGRIGSQHQAKIGVFGPVVNLGSRLESATKQIGVPVLIDQPTAEYVRENMPASEGRCRKIGLIRFVGLNDAVWVSELLPPESQSHLSDENIADFEAALEHFVLGNWNQTLDLLGKLPMKDRAKDFILLQIANHNYEPPSNWDGVISLPKK